MTEFGTAIAFAFEDFYTFFIVGIFEWGLVV